MPTIVDRCISDSSMSWASGSWAYLPQEFVGFTAKRFENLAQEPVGFEGGFER
jgi:hypothetical protein